MKKLFNCLILFIALFLVAGQLVFANVALDPIILPIEVDLFKDKSVVDDSNIISTKTEEYINKTGNELEKEADVKLLVMTVSNLSGYSFEEITYNLTNFVSITTKKTDVVVFFVYFEEESYDIKVSDSLSDVLSESDLAEIKEKYINSYFENDEWDNGVKNGYNAIYEKIVEAKDLDIDYTKPIDPNNENNTNVNTTIFTIVISLVIIVVTIICIIIEYTRKKKNTVKKDKKTKLKK